MIYKVILSKRAEKDIGRVPEYIFDKLDQWIHSVEEVGLEEVRKFKGLHDEPLKGNRKGERSIRLSKSYRAIYIILNERVPYCEVQEVNKHDY